MSNDPQLNSSFKQWLQNLGVTSRRKLLPAGFSADFGLYASTAQRMTNNLVLQKSIPLGSQAEQSSSRQANTDGSSGEVIEDAAAAAAAAAENGLESVNLTDYRIPVEVSKVDIKFSQVDAQTQTCSSIEAVKPDFDQASAEGGGGGEGGAEDNSLPDIIFSSTSSSGHSQATSPDVLLSRPKCTSPLSAEQNTGQCPSPPKSQSPESNSAKKCMTSSGYATQGSEPSELSMTGSYDDNIFFSPFDDDNKDPTKPWRLQQTSSSSLISDEFPSSETLITVCGKDEEETAEAGCESNRQENDWEENLSTEANASSSADYLHFDWRDQEAHELLKDLATQMIRRGEGVSYIRSQLYDQLNSFDSESGKQEAEMKQDDADEDEIDLRLIRFLRTAALCGNKECDVDRCLFFQRLLVDIETDLRNHRLLNSFGLHRKILLCVAKHSLFCSEIHCSVPWCVFFNYCDCEDLDEQLLQLMFHYRSTDYGIKRMISPEDSDAEFLQFDPDVSWPSVDDGRNQVPTSCLDFEVLAPAGDFGQTAYYAQTTTILPKLLYIRMHFAFDEIHAWNRLRRLRHHPNVVSPLWVYIFSRRVVVCSEVMTFGVKSLKDVLMENENVLLPMKTVQRFMVDVISAAEFLNENGVLYLLWTVDSIGVMDDNETVRLRDFSCAVDESCLQNDRDKDVAISTVCSALPSIITPPEMFANDIGRFSEIWGMGCLLFHLTTGSCVSRHLLHEDSDFVQKEVKRFCAVSSLKILRNVAIRSILSRVFVKKSQRLDSVTLKARLITAAAADMQ